jgi:hypothetical protein
MDAKNPSISRSDPFHSELGTPSAARPVVSAPDAILLAVICVGWHSFYFAAKAYDVSNKFQQTIIQDREVAV